MRQAFDYAKRFYEKLGFQASHEGMKYFLDWIGIHQ